MHLLARTSPGCATSHWCHHSSGRRQPGGAGQLGESQRRGPPPATGPAHRHCFCCSFLKASSKKAQLAPAFVDGVIEEEAQRVAHREVPPIPKVADCISLTRKGQEGGVPSCTASGG